VPKQQRRPYSFLDESQQQRIIQLLRDPDLPLILIAQRMDVSKSAIQSVNKKFHIREYLNGNRSHWRVCG
jgi:hypothetical protein